MSETSAGAAEGSSPSDREIGSGANWIWWIAGICLGIAALLGWLL
jgi:hypothetical protein